MEEELIQEYIRRFNQAFSLLPHEDNYSAWFISLTEDDLRAIQNDLAIIMIHDTSEIDNVFQSSALISYGYRLGVVRLKGRNECYTRQDGYRENAVYSYNLDGFLDVETDAENPDAGASHIIQWAVNPGSNIDVSDDIVAKMIIPMVKNLCKITPPGKRMECTLIIPPLSKDIEVPDWSSLFSGLLVEDVSLNIVNYGYLLNIHNDERKYIMLYQTDGYQEYLIVSAYELIRGHNACVGSMAFDISDADHQYYLRDIHPSKIRIQNRMNNYVKKKESEVVSDWDYVDCRYKVTDGFSSFLGKHPASFGREIYKLLDGGVLCEDNPIASAFEGNESLEVVEVCTRILGENNLYNISLGDLVYVSTILQSDKNFGTVSVKTGKTYMLGTYKKFASSVDLSRLPEIPSNYDMFCWKIRDKKKKIAPYFSLDVSKNDESQIIESIIDHFDQCTTSRVAEDLLYLYKKDVEPSAYFVAKVFLVLSQMETIEIESKNTYVSTADNVDSIEYKEIDKKGIKFTENIRETKSGKDKMPHKIKDSHAKGLLKTPIEELNLAVRSQSILKSIGVRTIGGLTKKTRRELYDVRIGDRLQEEIIRKLRERGLELTSDNAKEYN